VSDQPIEIKSFSLTISESSLKYSAQSLSPHMLLARRVAAKVESSKRSSSNAQNLRNRLSGSTLCALVYFQLDVLIMTSFFFLLK
jgi:hypothetical protein